MPELSFSMRFKLSAVFLLCLAMSCKAEMKLLNLQIKDHSLEVEIANTPELRTQGLMKRNKLSGNSGMLFIFPKDSRPAFWMKNTSLPLSLAFIASNGTIRQIEKLTPYSLEPVQSSRSIRYALEVNQGWFTERGIAPGDIITFPDETDLPKGY